MLVGHRPVVGLSIVVTVAGAMIAIQYRINAELALRSGSGIATAVVNTAVACLTLLVVAVAVRRPALRRLPRARTRWWYWIGGLGASVASWAVTTSAPKVGVAIVSVAFAAGYTTGGLFADRVGLGSLSPHQLTLARSGAAVLAVVAVGITAAGGTGDVTQFWFAAWVAVGGFLTSCAQVFNARVAAAVGDGIVATLVFFLVGLVFVSTICAVEAPAVTLPSTPWVYTAGILAAAYVVIAVRAVARLGALRLSLATIGGQLACAALLDLVAPVSGQHLTALKLVGAFVAFVAVALASGARPGMRRDGMEPVERAAR